MKTLDKNSAYAKLASIKESNGIDVSRYMREVASSDIVPITTLIFINKYYPLDQLYTYNKIHENRRKNPLYKNLVNEALPESDRAIALSSFVTQVMIHAKDLKSNSKIEDADRYMEIMDIGSILDAIKMYSEGSPDKLNEVFIQIRRVFKNLF